MVNKISLKHVLVEKIWQDSHVCHMWLWQISLLFILDGTFNCKFIIVLQIWILTASDIHIFFKKFQNSTYNCVAYAYIQQTLPQPFIPNRYFTGNTRPCSLIVNLIISGPRRWCSGLEHWSRKQIVGCSNPSCNRPKSLIQVVTAPLLNARQ